MKKLMLIALFIGFNTMLLCAQDGWSYKKYATITNNNQEFFILEYGTNGSNYSKKQVRWRFTNKSDSTLYYVSIAKRNYILIVVNYTLLKTISKHKI